MLTDAGLGGGTPGAQPAPTPLDGPRLGGSLFTWPQGSLFWLPFPRSMSGWRSWPAKRAQKPPSRGLWRCCSLAGWGVVGCRRCAAEVRGAPRWPFWAGRRWPSWIAVRRPRRLVAVRPPAPARAWWCAEASPSKRTSPEQMMVSPLPTLFVPASAPPLRLFSGHDVRAVRHSSRPPPQVPRTLPRCSSRRSGAGAHSGEIDHPFRRETDRRLDQTASR